MLNNITSQCKKLHKHNMHIKLNQLYKGWHTQSSWKQKTKKNKTILNENSSTNFSFCQLFPLAYESDLKTTAPEAQHQNKKKHSTAISSPLFVSTTAFSSLRIGANRIRLPSLDKFTNKRLESITIKLKKRTSAIKNLSKAFSDWVLQVRDPLCQNQTNITIAILLTINYCQFSICLKTRKRTLWIPFL